MYLPNVLCLLVGVLFAGSTIAGQPKKSHEPETIPLAIAPIVEATEGLGHIISQRPLGLTKAFPMQVQCWTIAGEIKRATKVAKKSNRLSMVEALSVLIATKGLVDTINSTLRAVIEAQPVFASISMIPMIPFVPHVDTIVLKNLKRQSKLSSKFGDEVMLKVPKAGREDGRERLEKIDKLFAQAIAVYEGKGALAEAKAIEDTLVVNKTAVPFIA